MCTCQTVQCAWSEWSDWSATCGAAKRTRKIQWVLLYLLLVIALLGNFRESDILCCGEVWKAYISSVHPSSGVGKCPRGGKVVGHSPTITHWSTLLLRCVCKCQSLALNSSTHASGNSIFDKFYLDHPSFLKVPCQFTDKRDSSERTFLFFRLYCQNICGGKFVILNAAYLRSSFIYVVIKPVFYSNQLSID